RTTRAVAWSAPDDQRVSGAVDRDRQVGNRGQRGISSAQLSLKFGHLSPQGVNLVLQLENSAYALQADAQVGQSSHLAQLLNVAPRITAPPTAGPGGTDETDAVVPPKGLRVHPRKFGGD